MRVLDVPRKPRRQKATITETAPDTAPSLTAWCLSCSAYTPMIRPKRTSKGGVVLTVGRCACGRGTYRVGGAGERES